MPFGILTLEHYYVSLKSEDINAQRELISARFNSLCVIHSEDIKPHIIVTLESPGEDES